MCPPKLKNTPEIKHTPTRTSQQAEPPTKPLYVPAADETLCFDNIERYHIVEKDGTIFIPVQTECAYPSEYNTQKFREEHDVYDVRISTSLP